MKKIKNTLIWQVSREEVPNMKSFIVGTMHIRDNRAFQFVDLFLNKIRECEVFATEFDLDDAQIHSVEEAMLLPEGQRLKDVMPEKLFNRIDKVLKKQTGMSLFNFEMFKPIAVTNFLTEGILSHDRLMSLDETLWNFAKENGKILRGIETFEEQLIVLKKLPIDDQVKGLKELVRNFTKFRTQLLKMTHLYEKADIVKIYKAAKQTAKGGRKILLYDRNKIMADRISGIISSQTACIAIGAGHLAGKNGVLRLLKQRGFILKPIHD